MWKKALKSKEKREKEEKCLALLFNKLIFSSHSLPLFSCLLAGLFFENLKGRVEKSHFSWRRVLFKKLINFSKQDWSILAFSLWTELIAPTIPWAGRKISNFSPVSGQKQGGHLT